MPAIVSATPQTFTLTGRRTATVLVKAGQYDWSNPDITDERFPLTEERKLPRMIELVRFNHTPTSGEVLAELEARGLKRPVPEDALDFGIEHPEEQRKNPVVFLHEPALVYGNPRVLVLDGCVGRRELSLDWFDDQWRQDCAFAGVRE